MARRQYTGYTQEHCLCPKLNLMENTDNYEY